MKKIQLVFAMVAVLTASVGVLGNALMPTDTYFQSEVDDDLSCSEPITVTPCTTGSAERCVVEVEGTNLFISKKINGFGECVEHERPM